MEKLTKRQNDILDYIKLYIKNHGYPPSLRDIGKGIGLSSPATVHAHLNTLIKKGYIKKDNSKNRTIELLVDNEYIESDTVKIPLLYNNDNKYINVPSYLVSKKDVFAFDVKSSMISSILENDIVIVLKSNKYLDSDIVLVKINNDIVVKKYSENKNIIGKIIGLYRKIK